MNNAKGGGSNIKNRETSTKGITCITGLPAGKEKKNITNIGVTMAENFLTFVIDIKL